MLTGQRYPNLEPPGGKECRHEGEERVLGRTHVNEPLGLGGCRIGTGEPVQSQRACSLTRNTTTSAMSVGCPSRPKADPYAPFSLHAMITLAGNIAQRLW
jgi:hypothetical protein